MNEGRGREEHEILCSKGALKSEVNIQMIKVEKKYTHKASIYSLSVTQNLREINISLEFEIEFVEPNFGDKISLIMISEF